MNNINNMNLIKMTLGIAFASAATFIVNADQTIHQPIKNNMAVQNSLAQQYITQQNQDKQKQDFSKLLSQFDTDNNGSLSEDELAIKDNKAVKIAFKNLDSNKDSAISVEEFTTYKKTDFTY